MSSSEMLYARERIAELAIKLVHGHQDRDGSPVTLETLVAAVSRYEMLLEGERR